MNKHIFYHPQTGVAADVIPFYSNDTFYLFYLKDERDISTYGEGVHWYLLTTKDFVHFTEHGIALPHGSESEKDLYAFTGSVVQMNNLYYIYYTGHNPHFISEGKPQEVILRAQSENLKEWKKDANFALYAPEKVFEHDDWRDPFVWYDEQEKIYHMIVMARIKEGAPRRRGITAHLTSSDGVDWKLSQHPFYAPRRFNAHECPDFFKMNNKEYMFYSEYSQEKVTRYVIRECGNNAWHQPKDDHIDGTAFYAAKTVYDGQKRFAVGWIPIRLNDCDTGAWQWGGCLCVHELAIREDGTLQQKLPQTIQNAFSVKSFAEKVEIDCLNGRDQKNISSTISEVALVNITLEIHTAKEIEIVIRASELTEEGTIIRLDFVNSKVAIDTWPRDPAKSFEPGLDRKVLFLNDDNKVHLQLLLDGSAGCVYVQNDMALSFRAYANAGNSLIVGGVDAKFGAQVDVYTMEEE